LTPHLANAHNRRSVSLSFGRAAASLILAPCIAFSAILAPEHVHEADHDHPDSTVHRHARPHAVAPPHHDHDHAKLADDDGRVVWLDAVALQPLQYLVLAPVASLEARFELASPAAGWHAKTDYNIVPPHGPPRACRSIRAPPSCLSA